MIKPPSERHTTGHRRGGPQVVWLSSQPEGRLRRRLRVLPPGRLERREDDLSHSGVAVRRWRLPPRRDRRRARSLTAARRLSGCLGRPPCSDSTRRGPANLPNPGNACPGLAPATSTAMMNAMRPSPGQAHEDDLAIPDQLWPLEDRGSFTHGVCRSCTWVGPGRRSRGVAARDAELHSLAGCQSPVAPLPDGSDLPDSSGAQKELAVTSGRERLTARGRS